MIFNGRIKPFAVLLGMLVICLGCSGNTNRKVITGKVTCQGKPIPLGVIYFDPDVTRGNSGPQGFAKIFNGEYRTDKIGRNAITGPLVVRIASLPGNNEGNEEAPGGTSFPPYETRIDLTEETETLDFDISARNQ